MANIIAGAMGRHLVNSMNKRVRGGHRSWGDDTAANVPGEGGYSLLADAGKVEAEYAYQTSAQWLGRAYSTSCLMATSACEPLAPLICAHFCL